MKKIYRLKDLDCANCAAKMERGIAKINGVKECSVNFIMQKLTLELDDSMDITAILKEIKDVCKKVEPDCEIIGL